jgi:hypothetical protein
MMKKKKTKKFTAINTKLQRGVVKVPLGSLPVAGRVHGALACARGNKKYGFYNFRESEQVSMMMYLEAIDRHCAALLDGENFDPEAAAEDPEGPPIHHAGAIIACAAIICDAWEHGNLLDDRPVEGPGAELIRRLTKRGKEKDGGTA